MSDILSRMLQLLPRIKSMGKQIKIGGILSNYIIKGPNINELLFRRCKFLLMKPKKKKAKKDFGHFILSLPEGTMKKSEFESLVVKKAKRLDKDLLSELISRFAFKKTKIDCLALRNAYMELYPETALPPPKPKKKKKGKKKGKKVIKEEPEVVLAVHNLENEPQHEENQLQEQGVVK